MHSEDVEYVSISTRVVLSSDILTDLNHFQKDDCCIIWLNFFFSRTPKLFCFLLQEGEDLVVQSEQSPVRQTQKRKCSSNMTSQKNVGNKLKKALNRVVQGNLYFYPIFYLR